MSEHVSARIEDELAEILNEPGRNKSETIEEALRHYFDSRGGQERFLRVRVDRLKDDIHDLENRLEKKRERLEHCEKILNEKEKERNEEQQEMISDIASRFDVVELSSRDKPMVDATDEELSEYTDNLDMTVEEIKNAILQEAE